MVYMLELFLHYLLKVPVNMIRNQLIEILFVFFAENGVLFMAYGRCQNFLCFLNNKTHHEQLTSVENMAAGSFAAVFSSLVLCPIELVKCRIQTMNDMPFYQKNQMRRTM